MNYQLFDPNTTITIGWISVDEALPPIGKTVITTDESKIGLGTFKHAYYNNTGNLEIIWTSDNEVWNPKYWIPLPKIETFQENIFNL
jgi:hypothetical protein